MPILRDLLRNLPFPFKLRLAKGLFKFGRPLIIRSRYRSLITPSDAIARTRSEKHELIEVLVILDRLPLPGRDAARVRMLAILKILAKFSRVTLILIYHRFENSRFEQAVRAIGIEIAGVFDYDRLLSGRHFDVALASYPHVAEYMLPEIRSLFPEAKTIFDTVDVHFVRLNREAELKNDRRLKRNAASLRRIETRLASLYDQTWCITNNDRDFLLNEAPAAQVHVVKNIHTVKTEGPPFEARHGLLFIGNFEHRPNVDAVDWLADEILPLVEREIRGIQLHLVGGGLPRKVAGIQRRNIVVHGFVEDVEPLYRLCRIVVAPLRFGGGMKGKIGEALSFGVPVVTTEIGAEGFGLTDGENVMLANDAAAFAANITRVYHNKEMWKSLSDSGRAFIATDLSPEAAEVRIRSAFNELLPGRNISRP